MRLAFLELNGFRGYRKPLRIDFAERFTIIDGRNGVGKSTIFDAVEFALSSKLGKYDDQKAAGETFADYIWWRGEGPAPAHRYVKVGFRDDAGEISVMRSEFENPDAATLDLLVARLCDQRLAPDTPLNQLCTNAIIRDEQITKLSLDLKDTNRYALLRDALGANDSDLWIERGARLVSAAKQRVTTAQQEVGTANGEVATAARRLDEVRASLVAETTMAEIVERLRKFANTVVPPDQLIGAVRERIAAVVVETESLRALSDQWSAIEAERLRIPALVKALEIASAQNQGAAAAVQALSSTPEPVQATSSAEDARKLIALATLGRQLGLHDGHCPLCAQGQTPEEFERGIQLAEDIARRMNESAARAAQQEEARTAATIKLATAGRAVDAAQSALVNAQKVVESFDQQRKAREITNDATVEQVRVRAAQLRQILEAAQKDLRILETLRLNTQLELAQRAEVDAKNRLARAQEKFGRARRAETSAQALHDAARRAASETLDRRLERVLPLMSELYRRLRPHPVWTDIEYSIRGDVRRFLTLQVGEDLNPQFLFSSGQRRATGLAFLLSINLSLAWSKWRTILLDDPVQHVDDFRTVHLAELAGQLVAEGRQLVCAVEDPALADLLCRRLPIDGPGAAKRITLGPDADGALGKVAERSLTPLVRNSLIASPGNQLQIR